MIDNPRTPHGWRIFAQALPGAIWTDSAMPTPCRPLTNSDHRNPAGVRLQPATRPRFSYTALRLLATAFVAIALATACGSGGSSGGSGSSSGSGSSNGGDPGPARGERDLRLRRARLDVVEHLDGTPKPLPPATHTSCRSVIYIGDSTSDGEALAESVPDRRLRAPAQLFRVGVRTTHMEVSGARSIYETFKGIPNGATVAQQEVSHGYHGCWIIALGTNDAADVAAGSTLALRSRIARMMSIIGDQPVMW